MPLVWASPSGFEVSCTFSAKSVSPTMWQAFGLMHKTFKSGAELYLEDMLPALDNFEEEDPWLSHIGTDAESFMPPSPLLTMATDESLDIAAEVKMMKEFDNQISPDCLLLWLIDFPALCLTVLATVKFRLERWCKLATLPNLERREEGKGWDVVHLDCWANKRPPSSTSVLLRRSISQCPNQVPLERRAWRAKADFLLE